MYKIAVDVMGMDKGSKVAVEAILKFIDTYKDVEVIAFGKEEELTSLKGKCEIVNCNDVMDMEDGALAILRKKETSMVKAVNYCKENNLDGVVSGGSTGAFITSCTVGFRLIENVSRAALVFPFPTLDKNKSVVILDIGANSENTPAHLLDFAKMGNVFSKAYSNIETPNIYLLNNGEEEKKGNELTKEAHKLIKESNLKGFKGNIEARYVLDGRADVIVCGGFDGNILLKSIEGTAKTMSSMLKEGFTKNIFTKISYLFAKGPVKELKERMDYKKYGGAMLLGVNKLAIKAHGSSDKEAFFNALRVCYELIDKKMIDKMKEEMSV